MGSLLLFGCEEEQAASFIQASSDVCPKGTDVYCHYIIVENNTPVNISYQVENNTPMNVSFIR